MGSWTNLIAGICNWSVVDPGVLFTILIGSPEASIPLWNLVTVPEAVAKVKGTKQLNKSVRVEPSQEVSPAAA